MATSNKLGQNGRLGNQLFQLAAAYAQSLRVNEPCWIKSQHVGELLALFPNVKKLIRADTTHRPTIRFGETKAHDLPPLERNLDFDGYFQSERYFEDYSNEVKTLFACVDTFDPETIGLHVRLTDYTKAYFAAFYHQLGPDYYERAIRAIEAKIGPKRLLVFSDEPAKARQRLPQAKDVQGRLEFAPPASGPEHFKQMARCGHFITANSSFSWWSSYLCINPEKNVVMPKLWVKDPTKTKVDDIYPKGVLVV